MKKANTIALGACFTFAVIIALLAAYAGIRQRAAAAAVYHAKWQAYAAERRAADEPVTFEDIELSRPEIDPESNGAIIIEEIAPELDRLWGAKEEHENVPFFDRNLFDDHAVDAYADAETAALDAGRQFREKHASLLQSLEPLRNTDSGRLSISYAFGDVNPMGFLLPDLSHWRTAARLLKLDIWLAVHNNDVERAVASTELIAHVANTLEQEPNVICRLVQVSLDGVLVDSIQGIMSHLEPDDKQIDRLERAVARRLDQPDLSRIFQCERAFNLRLYDGLADGDWRWSDVAGEDDIRFSIHEIDRNKEKAAALFDQLIRAAGDHQSLIEAAEAVDAEVRPGGVPPSPDDEPFRMLRHLFPALSRTAELHAMCIAELRSSLVCLSAVRFRRANGRWPAGIDDISDGVDDAVMIDPFNGESLRVIQADGNFIVYSVGVNREDDGGLVSPDEDRRRKDAGVSVSYSGK